MVQNETTLRVRYKDTDQMGVAYYANYLTWFEVGRTEIMRSLDLPYKEFERYNLFLPVLKAYCEYKHSACYDDLLTIVTCLDRLKNARVTFKYEVRRDEELLAEGYTEHAFVNNRGRPVALKKHSPELWDRLNKALK